MARQMNTDDLDCFSTTGDVPFYTPRIFLNTSFEINFHALSFGRWVYLLISRGLDTSGLQFSHGTIVAPLVYQILTAQ
jgi:hypothetical protein